MATQEKEPLSVEIIDAAPELDFLFALARRIRVSITFSVEGGKLGGRYLDVYIDSISVLNPTSDEPTDTWLIEGHFRDDEESLNSASIILHKPMQEDGVTVFDQIAVWGSFKGKYHKGKRIGRIQVFNWRRRQIPKLFSSR